METKELIFNGKKFFEGKYPCYVGKRIVAPRNDLKAYQFDKWSSKSQQELAIVPDNQLGFSMVLSESINNAPILGQFINSANNNSECYLYVIAYLSDNHSYYGVAIKYNDLLQNGGVSASLNHALLRRKELVS